MIDLWVWAVMLIVVAIGLAVLELFVPSGGVLAFLSIASIIAALILGFKSGPGVFLILLTVIIVGLPAGLGLAVKWWPHTPIGQRILLRVGGSEESRPDDDFHRGLKELVGQVGEAKSKMLPSGAIVVAGRTIDAYTEGVPIEPGQPVVILEVHGTRVLVRPLEDDEPPSVDEDCGLTQPIDSIGPDPFTDSTA